MLTRREFGALTRSGLALPALSRAQVVSGVRLGVQTYSFRGLPRAAGQDLVDPLVAAMKACGLTDCELWAPQIEPVGTAGRGASAAERERDREALRAFRVETPLDHFQAIRRTFADAGMTINAFNYSFNDGFSDEEIDRGFVIARALGAEIITASTTLDVCGRVAPVAEKHGMAVAVHNHSNTSDPNEFATPESFAAAMRISRQFKVNLDIGHFTAANYDAVAWLREHHDTVTNLHIKDRRRDQGANVPWGTGDTPIREVLRLLGTEGWPIRAHLEYEHRGEGTPVQEVSTCLEFARAALA
jgi:sugar phosphate isomerase/epimerase